MAEVELTLSWLGLSQYTERFIEAGFDSWETILWITESDLEVVLLLHASQSRLMAPRP